MMKRFLLVIFLCFIGLFFSKAQTVLNANSTGTGDTYALINSVLAPGANAIEAPDQSGGTVNGTHPSFGKHIAQVYDTDLAKYVFEFYAHVAEDNDITGGLVRQRVEIKTYAASPNNLKATLRETVIYKWRFKIPVGFQPSSTFTHIHQIKAVDGDASSPLFTLTPRKGSPNKLELIYAQDANSGQDKKVIVNLSDFEGNWVEATETIKVGTGTSGAYAINIKRLSDGVVLLSYSNNNIQTIRTAASDPATPQVANTFIRPKWGIYRSLNTPSDLRDESIRFSDISIQEIPLKIILKLDDFSASNSSSKATPILDYLITKKIKAGIGFIASRNDATALSVYQSYLNAINTSGDKLFEVWHHGLDHVNPEFKATTYAYQKAHFDQGDQLIKDNLRVQMHSFGSPYNANDATTNTVISENTNYKVTMFNNPAADVSTGILNLNNRVNMENGTGKPDYAYFINNYNSYKSTYTDYMVLQGHPNLWTSTQLAQFSQIIDFLISEGVEFVLPYEYFLSLNPSVFIPNITQTISFSALTNKMSGDIDFDPSATSNSGLAVTYNSSNPSVCTIVDGKIHIVGPGTSVITASQMGTTTYKPADFVSQTLTVNVAADFRSGSTGNWNTPATWQVRDGNGSWFTATSIPTAFNNVYIQNGHTVTVNTTDANCYNLHINATTPTTAQGILNIIGSFNVNVNGKIRAYTGASVTSAVDGGYTGASTTTMVAGMIVTTSTGVLKFVGGTRDITITGEWNGSSTTNNTIFALDLGAVGVLNTSIKFRTIIIASGVISSGSTISVGSNDGNGNITIKNGASLISSRSYTSAGSQLITYSSSSKCGQVNIESGGILELTGANPAIDCTTFTNNGTITYSGTAQTFIQVGAGAGTPITSYTNLTISGTGIKTIPASTNIAIAGILTFVSGSIAISPLSTLEISNANTEIIGADEAKYIQTLNTGNTVGVLKVVGLSTAKTFPLGTSANYLPVTLSPVNSSTISIHVFEGVTTDATPNGTAFTTNQKKTLVDAVWNLSRTSGTGNCVVTLGWQSGLEGVDFAGLSNPEVGISQYTGGAYTSFSGSGDNSVNTTTQTFSSLTPLSVGKVIINPLPINLVSFIAVKQLNAVQLKWSTLSEQNNSHFEIEKSTDGITFFAIGSKAGAGNSNTVVDYFFTDHHPINGVNYYRLKQVDLNGETSYGATQFVSVKNVNLSIQTTLINDIIEIGTSEIKQTTLYFFNSSGQTMLMVNGRGQQLINVAHFSRGIYFVKTNEGDAIKFLKL